MPTLTEIDSNFAVETGFPLDNLKIYSPLELPFKIHGLIYNGEGIGFTRIPLDVAEGVSEGVAFNNTCTAGGRLRFRTNSRCVAIFAKLHNINGNVNMSPISYAGFDIYVDGRYADTFTPPPKYAEFYPSKRTISNDGLMHDVEINFPSYSGVLSLSVGLEADAKIAEATPYKEMAPIVYYGSSITQGGCATRPGNAYTSIISRRIGCDFLCLGFSGSAKGERRIAEYISELDMSVFVYDYDYNSPTHKTLKETHEQMFKIIREKNPELPIIMVSRPVVNETPDSIARYRVISETYENATANNDKNVYLINGHEMICSLNDDGGLVDGIHPGDSGFLAMANVIGKQIENILGK